MPLQRSDAILDLSDPNVVIGPRRRRPTERLLENGDPLVCKKARRNQASIADASDREKFTLCSTPLLTHPIDSDTRATPPPTQTTCPTNDTESSDDEASDGVREIIVGDSDGDEGSDEGEVTDEDDDAELARLQKEWDAPIYAFFKPLPSIQYIENRKAHVFECSATQCRCRSRFVRRYLDTSDSKSTSNLRRHAKVCWSDEAVQAADSTRDVKSARDALQGPKTVDGSITAAFQRIGEGKVTYSHRQHTKIEARVEFVRWVTENNRPFRIVDDRGFRCLMKTGRPGYYIPSADTLSRDVKNVFVRVRERIAKTLRKYDGKLSFATDSWTSPNHKSFVAITVHFERAGKACMMLLDLVEVAKSHTGVNLGIEFLKVLRNFGIQDKILSITGDNASNNDTMIQYLGEVLDEFPGPANQTRCFAHTVNLIVKSILKPFELRKNKQIQEFNNVVQTLADTLEDGDIEEEDREDDEDGEDDEDDEDNADNEDEGEDDASLAPIKSMLLKLRKIAFAIKNSPTIIQPAWEKALSTHGFQPCMMPQDVSTRWNSTFDMLVFAIQYRDAIDSVTAVRGLDLRKYELVLPEWKIAEELRDVLRVFKEATLFFSRGTPNLATVIPAMDHINKVLTTSIDSSSKLSLAIRAALTIGKRTLNKYYDKTGESEVYRIAMVLHPRNKLEYFKRRNWDDKSINTAREIVQDEFDRSYWLLDVEGDRDTTTANGNTTPSTCSEPKNMFDDLMDYTPTSSFDDELQHYLSMDVEDVKDGLMWWHERRAMFPRLSRMARDYLAIPATSVDVERVFSRGRLVLPHVRNRLAVESTRASICVGLWSSQGLVQDIDLTASLSADGIVEEPEDGLPTDWDVIHNL